MPENALPNALPAEVQDAYETLLRLAVKNNLVFSGVMMRTDPPLIALMGNVRETGSKLAELWRMYADVIEAAEGQVEDHRVNRPI